MEPPAPPPFLEETYPVLRRIARGLVAREPVSGTLSGTALLNESLLRLLGYEGGFSNPQHLMGVVVNNMRRILIDRGRRRGAIKRTPTDRLLSVVLPDDPGMLAVRQAYEKLCQFDPAAGQIVRLHIFEGHTLRETAELSGMTVSAVRTSLKFSETWLRDRITG